MVRPRIPLAKYEIGKVIQPIYSGGSVALSEDGLLLATALEGDALLTYLPSGRHQSKIHGVCLAILC